MLRHSDSTEELSSELNSASISETQMEDFDLEKELGLDEPQEVPKPKGKQPERGPAMEKASPPPYSPPSNSSNSSSNSSASSGGGGWWGGVWAGATSLVSTANSSDISKAMWGATEKAAAAVSSLNESYKISESLANVASIVEKKGVDLKNITLNSVDKFLDTIDPIETESTFLYSAEDFEANSLLASIKVIVTSVDPHEISSVINAFEKIYGEERVYARGMGVESGFAKQPIGFKFGMKAASQKIQNLQATDTFKENHDLLFVSIENFIAEVEGEWYDFYAIVINDQKNQIITKGFSQGIPIPSEVAEKVRNLTPLDYEFRDSGASVSVSNIMAMTSPQVKDTNWYSLKTDGRVDKALVLEIAVGAICGSYWATMKEKNIIPSE